MDFSLWMETHRILNAIQIRENIIQFEEEKNGINQIFLLKRIDDLSEYLIHKDLISLDLPIFQKDIQLLYSLDPVEDLLGIKDSYKLDRNDKFYILMTKIEGNNLKKCLKYLSSDELDCLIQTILWSLKIAWNELKFVHLDLHLGNIFVKKLEQPIIIHLSVDDKRIEIETKWIPILIDFGDSITQRYNNSSTSQKTILHDIWKFIGTLSMFTNTQQSEVVLQYLSYLIDPLLFQEKKEYYASQWFQVLP